MNIKKWDYKNKRYNLIEISNDLQIGCDDNITSLDKKINCVQCNCIVRLGSSYQSKVYKDLKGNRLCVCGDCMFKEHEEFLENLPSLSKEIEKIKDKIWYIENKDTLDYNDEWELHNLYTQLKKLEEQRNEVDQENYER